ncbi:MAG: hypothetical protein ACOYNL_05585 [Rickettsiales bacterium]|jgi:hypothetical protein
MQTARKYTHDVTAHMERSLHKMTPRLCDGGDVLPNTRSELASYVDHLLTQKRTSSSSTALGRDSCNWSTD